MSVLKSFGGRRMFLAFLIAPALVPIWSILLFAVSIDTRQIDCGAGLAMFILVGIPAAIVMWYACIVGLGLPWVLLMRDKGELRFRTIMAPIRRVAYPLAVLFFVFGVMHGLLSAVVAALWLSVVILSVLCFYFIAVWQPCGSAQKGL